LKAPHDAQKGRKHNMGRIHEEDRVLARLGIS